MKKAEAFNGIPAVPNSIAGQWLAFSHMANHYRKLFNVKPRVDSFALNKSNNNNNLGGLKEVHPLSAYLKGAHLLNTPSCSSKPLPLSKPKKVNKELAKSKSVLKAQPSHHQQYNNVATSLDSSPRSIIKRPATKNNKKLTKAKSSIATEYHQLVRGPQSIQSSTTTTEDHLSSNCEEDGISQPEEPKVETMGVAEKIKAFLDNLQHFSELSPRPRLKPKMLPFRSVQSQSKTSVSSDAPLENDPLRPSRHSNCFLPSSETPKRSPYPIKKGVNSPKKLSDALGKKTTKANSSMLTIMAHNNKSNNDDKRRHLSGDSVGTVRGSEKLTAEDQSFTHLLDYNKEEQEVPEVPKRKQSSIKKGARTPSAGYCSQSVSGKATSQSSSGPVKDSSRDSAYGFSSGESRTTRDSTPERIANKGLKSSKNKKSADNKVKYKSALSTVASSVNFNSSENIKKKAIIKHGNSEDKYLNFVTDVTVDIVMRGIYTNRGLKDVFQEHLRKHKNLDQDRMKDLLEKLRMDLGIPKNNNLNKLEFGYGSVLTTTSTNPYFYTNESPKVTIERKKFHFSTTLRREDVEERISDDVISPPPPNNSYNFVTLDFDSGSDQEEIRTKSDEEESPSASELKRTLREVGIDSETTMEIVNLIKSTPSHHYTLEETSTTSDDDNSTSHSSCLTRNIHKSKSCSIPHIVSS